MSVGIARDVLELEADISHSDQPFPRARKADAVGVL